MSETEKYQIVPFTPKPLPHKEQENPWDIDYFESTEPRFAISDSSGKILDDAQGYGYRSRQKAHLALNWKYLGGKGKSNQKKIELKRWVKSNPIHKEIINKYHECIEINFKEIVKGEVTQKDIWDELEKQYNIKIPDFIKKQSLKQQ